MQAPPDVVVAQAVLAQPARSLPRLLSYPVLDVAERQRRAAPERTSLAPSRLTSMMAPRRPPRAGPDELRWYEPFSARCRPHRCQGPFAARTATAQPLSAGPSAALRARLAFRPARVR